MNFGPLLEALGSSRPAGVGVAEWSVCAVGRRRFSLGTRDRRTGGPHSPPGFAESLGARYLLVWEDGKVSRGTLEKRQMIEEAPRALDVARAAAYDDPDATEVRGGDHFPEVELFDPGVAALVAGDTAPFAERLASVRNGVVRGGFRTWSGSFSASAAFVRLLSSKGLDVEERGTSAGWYVSFAGEWGDGFAARALETRQEFEGRLERLVETVTLLGRPCRPPAAGVVPVVLHPHVVEDLFLGTLLRNLEGSAVAHGEGHFPAGEFGSGRAALREDLSLELDPRLPLRAGSYRFTSEGVPARACAFIAGGRLVTPILNLKYARRLAREPTPIPQAADTLRLTTSRRIPRTEAWGRAAGGVLVLAVLGTHTLDTASGDFSLSAPQALFLGADGPRGRVRGTLSGNVFDVLRRDDLDLVEFEGESTPGMLFPCRLDPT